MASPEERLKELGITLPILTDKVMSIVPAVRTGNLLYLSGVALDETPDGKKHHGKLGREVTVEQGYQVARMIGIYQIARMKKELGDLRKVKRIVKLLSMVNSTPDFTETPAVSNGCSDLLVEVFGEPGRHARSAVGMATLPAGLPVEIEMIIEVA